LKPRNGSRDLGVRLSRRFFARPTLDVARDLVGRTLVSQSPEGTVAGRLVEVEAYCGAQDPASHAFRRATPRNSVMFGPPGHLYVYFTYGMHFCANIVTEPAGTAGAVLLRAVEPLHGLDLMAERRGVTEAALLARGPARLCQAFGLGRSDNGADLMDGPIWVTRARRLKAPVKSSIRIGLRPGMDQPWRFYEEGPWASKLPAVKHMGAD
jgi:DNA-3-methyladenine glycosylase